MKLYAETAGLRARQLLGDLATLAWTAAWVAAGLTLYRLVERLAVPGARVEQAGSDFAGDVAEIQQRIGRVPVVGDQLQGPFGRLAGTGRTLAEAGATQQEVVHQLALWLGVVVAAVPVVTLLLVWLPRRVAWAREAGAASRLRLAGADLADRHAVGPGRLEVLVERQLERAAVDDDHRRILLGQLRG